MPNYSGVWTPQQVFQGRGQDKWARGPAAPTSPVASVASATSISVAFTASADSGKPPEGIANYIVTASDGTTATGSSSPIVVTGLTEGTAYTFTVRGVGSNGLKGPNSSVSNSATPVTQGQQAYTTAGTYSWTAPSGVSSVSVVVVGGGGNSQSTADGAGSGGGGLAYGNNISVTAGNSYTVVVGSGTAPYNQTQQTGGTSSFNGTSFLQATGGGGGNYGQAIGTGGSGSGSARDGGGDGGDGGGGGGAGNGMGGGGGAGGYSGNGGDGVGTTTSGNTTNGANGAGGGGGGGARTYYGGGGGGVGILGEGTSGLGGTLSGTEAGGGGGGSGGEAGQPGSGTNEGRGGSYGGGSGGYGMGSGSGAVRIIWPGTSRQFPSTNTGNV